MSEKNHKPCKNSNSIDNQQVTNILTIDPIVLGKYIRLTPVHDLSRIARKKDMCFLCSSLYGFHSINQFLDMYKESCVSHQKKLPDGQKHRYGWNMDILLPRREWSDDSLKKFVSEFVKGIIGKEQFIRYIAYKYRTGVKNDVQRVRIWFCDRECYPIPGKSRYKRDYYKNKNTHKFCKSTDPDAELAYRKGEIIRDSEEHMFSATKSRILNIKQEDFQSFRVWLAGYFEDVLKTCGVHVEQKKYRYKRVNIWKAMSRYSKRTAVAQNRAIIYVENEINRIYESRYAARTVAGAMAVAWQPGKKTYLQLSKPGWGRHRKASPLENSMSIRANSWGARGIFPVVTMFCRAMWQTAPIS